MKNAMHDILLFGAGFAAGAYFMHTVMRRAYDEKYRKEAQDLKAHWEKREANLDEEVEKKANQKGFELAMGPYRTESRKIFGSRSRPSRSSSRMSLVQMRIMRPAF